MLEIKTNIDDVPLHLALTIVTRGMLLKVAIKALLTLH